MCGSADDEEYSGQAEKYESGSLFWFAIADVCGNSFA
jgi:hypothetical protein